MLSMNGLKYEKNIMNEIENVHVNKTKWLAFIKLLKIYILCNWRQTQKKIFIDKF